MVEDAGEDDHVERPLHRRGQVLELHPADQVELDAERRLDQGEAAAPQGPVVTDHLGASAPGQERRDQTLLHAEVQAAGAGHVGAAQQLTRLSNRALLATG